MDILPISELPQPSLTTEVPQTTPVSLQSLLPPFCNPASQTQLDDYFSVIAVHLSVVCSVIFHHFQIPLYQILRLLLHISHPL